MPAEKIVHIKDFERRSREPDAEHCRDPAVIQFSSLKQRRAWYDMKRFIAHGDVVDMQMPCDC